MFLLHCCCCVLFCQVLAQGYSVGRVEEMPAAAATAGGRGGSRGVLVRRLVRIYSPGTAVEGLLVVGNKPTGSRLASLVLCSLVYA